MKTPVIAIGLDSADPVLLEKWMSQGYLKNLNRLKREGTYGRLKSSVPYQGVHEEFSNTEPLWVMFSTGCLPNKTGFWDTAEYQSDRYRVICDKVYSGYDYREYPPFYALGDDYRVAVFDVPVARLSNNVNGLQSLGWGGHFPFVSSESNPPQLLPNLIEKYGENPLLFKDNKVWWRRKYSEWLLEGIKTSTSRRAKICQDLLEKEPWDLFITTFGDTHSASHDLLDRSQPEHPLYSHRSKKNKGSDPMLEAFEAVDRSIGEIVAAAPDNAYILCYSVHGMGANVTDLLSMMFLGEILYRFNFPGKQAIAPGKLGTTPPPPITRPIRNSWFGEVWRQIYEPNPIKRLFDTWTHKAFLQGDRHGLISPYRLQKLNRRLRKQQQEPIYMGWMPASWYRPLWSKMRAFALPAFADGHIRINLKGRERDGIVEPSEYDALCDELTQILHRLKHGRTGEPLVEKVIRTRQSATEDDTKLPHADLIVLWHKLPTDVVDSPDFGRIGPVTYNRPGSHRPHGFLLAKGPGIQAGSDLPEGHPVDIAPTILKLMNAPIPEYFDGKPLIESVRAKM